MANDTLDNVYVFEDQDDYDDAKPELKGKRSVYILSSKTCGPCRTYSPMWKSEAKKHPGITFVYIDCNDCPVAADSFDVVRMPTTIAINSNGKEIRRFEGPDIAQLRMCTSQLNE